MTCSLAMSTSLLWPARLSECLTRLAHAGFGYVEITPSHIFRDLASRQAAAAVAEVTRAVGISVATVHLPFGSDYDLAGESEWHFQQAYSHLLQIIEIAHVLGTQGLVLHPSDTERRQVASVAEVLLRLRRRVASLLGVCQGLGLVLALEHMLPHLIGGRVEELRAIADPLLDRHLRFCVDVSHASFAGDPTMPLDVLAGRLSYVHASDNRGHRDDHLLPGEGRLPWERIADTLTRIGFAGTVIVEPAPRALNAEELARMWEAMAARFGGARAV